jgi:predicted Zn-dependent protease
MNRTSRQVTECLSPGNRSTATHPMLARLSWSATVPRLLALGSVLLLLQSESVFGHGGYHERMDYLTAAVALHPSDPLLYFELANLHGDHGDLQLALQNLDRADTLAPGKFLTDLSRGQALLVAGEFSKAKEALDRQLVSHPECARAWLLRARAEGQLGQDAAGLADYREALKRTPSPDPDLVQEVAVALATRNCQKEALQVLAMGIARLGKIPSLVLRALDLEIAMKDFEAALRRIEEARQAAPRPEPWMARRAAVLAQAGRIKESRAAWKALAEHLNSLPDQERTSYAMSKLTEETSQALATAKSLSAAEPPAMPIPPSSGK